MRAGSLPTRCSANWSTTVRTAFECPSRLASPQPTTPSSVSIRTKSHRGGTRKVSTLLIGMDSPSFGDDRNDLVDNLVRGHRNVDGHAGFVSLSSLEIVELRAQQRRWHVLVSPGCDPCVDQGHVTPGEDREHRGSVFPKQVSVAALAVSYTHLRAHE